MIGIKGKNLTIGIAKLPERKKPCLVVCEGNVMTKVASFNDEESVRWFASKLEQLMCEYEGELNKCSE